MSEIYIISKTTVRAVISNLPQGKYIELSVAKHIDIKKVEKAKAISTFFISRRRHTPFASRRLAPPGTMCLVALHATLAGAICARSLECEHSDSASLDYH